MNRSRVTVKAARARLSRLGGATVYTFNVKAPRITDPYAVTSATTEVSR